MDLTPAYPPFRMKAADAAYYTGQSISSFFRAVAAGEFPDGRKGIGGTYWLRADLEAAMVNLDSVTHHNFAQKI